MHRFVLFIYQGTTPLPGTPGWDALPPDAQQAIYADYQAVNTAAGVSPGLPLGRAASAITVRVLQGTAQTTAAPYLPDGVAGYLVVEAASQEEAIAVAARIPAARLGGAVEVRPVEVYW